MNVLLKVVLGLLTLVLAVLLIGPREPTDGEITFSADDLGDDLDGYLADSEAQFDDITPGVEKRIVWAGDVGARTDIVLLYLHGFSATSEEIRPVPDRVAEALGANLYYARFTGHGRAGAAMGEVVAADWRNDLAEAMEIGRRLGDRVFVIGTSTGATLSMLAAADPRMNDGFAGQVLVAPNFKVNNPLAFVPDLPFARHYITALAGEERSWEPVNEGHGRYWTTSYPTLAVLPMSATVRAANSLNFGLVNAPTLMIFDPGDEVVDHARSAEVAAKMVPPAEVVEVAVGATDDPFRHVIAGDILSPGMTDMMVESIVSWISATP